MALTGPAPPLLAKLAQLVPMPLAYFFNGNNLSLSLAPARSGWSLAILLFHTQNNNNGELKPSFGRKARSQGSSALWMLFMFTFYL